MDWLLTLCLIQLFMLRSCMWLSYYVVGEAVVSTKVILTLMAVVGGEVNGLGW